MFRISYKMVVITNKMYEFYQHFRNFYPQTNIWFNRSCHNIVKFHEKYRIVKVFSCRTILVLYKSFLNFMI